ncbi:MAG TPA: matrixin family metalloprotease [Vicinamibacterales bacterium]|nr:matrixin family metalloprotease [Vicinamibacterales bacterium]
MKPVALWLACVMAIGTPAPALGYLKFGLRISSGVVDVRWHQPVRYFVTERSIPGVSAAEFRDVATRAFATWQAAPLASIQSEFQGFTTALPGLQDGRVTLGFLDRLDLDRVLGATSFLLDASTGAILEADVFINTRFNWSVAPAGEAGRIDLESVMLHEIGHLLGLGHSALGETEMIPGGRRVLASGAVMFPIAFSAGTIADRQLQPDDLAGISDLYRAPGFAETTSSISGRITKNGNGVFGAHVTAVNLTTGELIAGFSLNTQGEYVIAGLPPGSYVLRVEPLDDADPDAFFAGPVDVDFRVTYGARVVIAPQAGGADSLDIQVRPK